MAGIEVNIAAEDINKLVAQAVLESAIGVQVREVIEEALRTYDFRQSVGRVVRSEVSKLIRQLLTTEYAERITEGVRTQISVEVAQDLAGKALQSWLDQQ